MLLPVLGLTMAYQTATIFQGATAGIITLLAYQAITMLLLLHYQDVQQLHHQQYQRSAQITTDSKRLNKHLLPEPMPDHLLPAGASSYQWYRNNVALGTLLIRIIASSAGQYYCKVTVFVPGNSNVIVISVNNNQHQPSVHQQHFIILYTNYVTLSQIHL